MASEDAPPRRFYGRETMIVGRVRSEISGPAIDPMHGRRHVASGEAHDHLAGGVHANAGSGASCSSVRA